VTTIESYRLSPQQRRLWADAPRARVTARVAITEPLDPERLRAAAAVVVARHETLRLKIGDLTSTGLPVQVVDDGVEAEVRVDGATHGVAPLQFSLTATELVVDASVLVADRESLRIVLREVAAAYTGDQPAPDPERIQFLDVVDWLEDQDRLDPPPDPEAVTELALPYRGGTPAGPLPAVDCTLPVSGDASPEAVVLAAWTGSLARHAGTAGPLTLAWYDDGRSVDGTTGVVGPLATAVRLDIPATADAPAVRELLGEARARSLRVAPLDGPAAAGFAFVAAADPLTLAGAAAAVTLDGPSPAAPLHLQCTWDGTTARLVLHADPAAAGPAAARMLLDSVAATLAGQPPYAAEAAVLLPWEGHTAEPGERTLVGLLDAGVRGADPRRQAVVAPDGTLTFGELDGAANLVAHALRERGVRPGDRVVVLGERSATTVAAFLGVLRAGAVYVPLDPAHPAAWLRRLATTVDAALAIGPAGSPALGGFGGAVPTMEIDLTGPAVPPAGAPTAGAGDPAYIIFTSGSTGTPRPVVVGHGNAAHLFDALQQTVYAGSPGTLLVAVNAPFTFDASMKQLVQLAAGRSLLLPSEDTRRDVPALLAELATRGADVLDCTPSHLRLILDHREPGQRLPGLLLIGGEAVDADLWERVAAIDGVTAYNLYGPTECTVDTTAALIAAGEEPSIGRPLPGFRVRVLDAADHPVPPGVPGELFVTGPQVTRGYWGDPVATAERFAVVDSTRGYRTGDRVRFLDDGRLAYLGRADDQIKVNGHRAEPAEIAAVVARHPAVRQAVVSTRAGAASGADALVAYVVPRRGSGRELSLQDIAGVNPHETRYLFDEIFVQRTYLRGGVILREDAVVVDVGANIGMFSLFVDRAVPGARILAFEPLPEAYACLERNLAGRTGRTELFGFGLSDHEHAGTFTVYPGYSMMSGQAEYADPASEIALVERFLSNRRDRELLEGVGEVLQDRFAPGTQPVELRRLSDVLTQRDVGRIDLLKIDVQRAEWDVLRGLDDRHLAEVQQIAMEVHDDTGGAPGGRVAEITAYLTGHGFEVFAEQDELLRSTDRFTLCAVRPGYRDDPRPVAEPPVAMPDTALLRQWLADQLPEPLVPASFVILDEIPLTANGKVDRSALPAPRPSAAGEAQPPATATERALIGVWEEVLGRTGIGAGDNFFEIGGDSIRAIRMRAAALRAGLSFPLRDVFRCQTVRALAAGIAGPQAEEDRDDRPFALLAAGDRALVPDGVVDAYPLTALQLGMVYHSEVGEGAGHAYHVVTADTVEGRWAPAALTRAAAELTVRHEILRTSFDLTRFSEPMQLVHARAEVPVVTADLAGLPAAEREERIRAVVAAEKAAPFDWGAPMLRLHALRTAERTFVLVQTHFHGALDGLSLHLMTRELLARYDAAERGTPAPEDRPALPYRRYVEAERAARADPAVAAFWRAALDGVRPMLLAGPGISSIDVTRVVEVPHASSAALDRAARRAGVPLKSLLLAAHVRALAAAWERDDVVTGIVVSGRLGEEGGDRTLGLFLNTVPLAARATGPGDELPARLWEYEKSLMGHHTLPLTDIQLTAGAGNLFDSIFNYTRFDGLAPVSGGSRVVTEHDDTVDIGVAVVSNADVGDRWTRFLLQYDVTRLPAARVDAYADRLRAEVTALLTADGTGQEENR
jgi:amino acid adenylation domain-containing protein/FkbM family methyltransferase